MAERLQEMPPRTSPRANRHPWEDWTDGSVWRIKQGADGDFPGTVNAMRIRLYGKARELKTTVEVRPNEAEGEIVFQFQVPGANS